MEMGVVAPFLLWLLNIVQNPGSLWKLVNDRTGNHIYQNVDFRVQKVGISPYITLMTPIASITRLSRHCC